MSVCVELNLTTALSSSSVKLRALLHGGCPFARAFRFHFWTPYLARAGSPPPCDTCQKFLYVIHFWQIAYISQRQQTLISKTLELLIQNPFVSGICESMEWYAPVPSQEVVLLPG